MSRQGQEKLLDHEKALERLSGMQSLYEKLLAEFVKDTPPKVLLLEKAIAEANHSEMLRLSHALKNSSAIIQAEQMTSAALQMEESVRSGHVENMAELFEVFRTACSKTLQAISEGRSQ